MDNNQPPSDSDVVSDGGEESTQHSVNRRDRSSAVRFAGLGIELATCTLAFTGIGYCVDWFFQIQKSYATAVGTAIGFTIGMIRFMQQALKNAR